MAGFLAWIKANPWKFAVAILIVLCVVAGAFGYGCGYVKGCNKAKAEVEEAK